MAAITSITDYEVSPNSSIKCMIITYTKAGTSDTIDVGTYPGGVTNIIGATARKTSDGADDPVDWSGTTLTLSAGTGSGFCVVYYQD